MNLQDRRVGKTRKAIFNALNELLREKKFAKITVQDIIDRANVGRATFYAHFPTKDDVLISYVETFFESFNEQIKEHAGQNGDNIMLPIAALFTHVRDNEKTISGLLMSESGTVLFDNFKKYWTAKIMPLVRAHTPEGQKLKVPPDMLTNHIISTIIELIKFWLQDGARYMPEQMEQFLLELIQPSFNLDCKDVDITSC